MVQSYHELGREWKATKAELARDYRELCRDWEASKAEMGNDFRKLCRDWSVFQAEVVQGCRELGRGFVKEFRGLCGVDLGTACAGYVHGSSFHTLKHAINNLLDL